MKFRKKHWILLILIVATFLRLYRLNANPPSLYWDEVSLGYNAFSILTNGTDEHGTPFPVTNFLAFGDAKPPLYIYAIVPFMKVFGANEWSVRLPSALAGILAVYLTFLIATHIKKPLKIKSQYFPIIAMALLAISPWHLQMSRVAYEANLALTLFLGALTAFLYAPKRPWLYILSAILFVSTWYTFNAYRIFLPLFIVFLGVLYVKDLWKKKIYVGLSIIVALVLTVPLIPFALSDQAHLRFEEVTIFKDLDPVLDANSRIELNNNAIWAKIVYNRRVMYASEFLDGFLDHFKVDFLFFSGDVNPRLGVREMGEMYLIELPLLLVGLYYLARRKSKMGLLLIVWTLLAVVPGAVARETPHALRILQVLPVPLIIVAIGLVQVLQSHKSAKFLVAGAYVFFFSYYINLYYVHYPLHWSESWQYGYKELVYVLEEMKPDYDRIYITNSLGRASTNFLFYSKQNVPEYLATRDTQIDQFGFVDTYSYGKYYFEKPDGDQPDNERWLFVDRPDLQLPPEDIIKTIYDLKGKPVFLIHEK